MKYISVCLLALLFLGCSKSKPRAGLYWAEFYAIDSTGTQSTRYDSGMNVSEPSDNSISINGATLDKKGSAVTGTIYQTTAFALTQSGLSINGKWKQKGAYYHITGDFTAFTAPQTFYGTFQMVSY